MNPVSHSRHRPQPRSWPALALGLFSAGVTARFMLDDVVNGAPVTAAHIGSIAALVTALGALHFAWPAIRSGAVVAGLILGLVGASATGYVVVAASLRNAETAASKTATATKAAGDRRAADAEWRRLSGELAGLGAVRTTQAVRASMDAVVGDGPGRVPVAVFRRTTQCTDITRPASAEACRPLSDLRVEMASAIRRADLEHKTAAARAKLDGMPAVTAPDTGFAHAGRVMAALPGVTAAPEAIAERLALIMPVAVVLISEGATLGFMLLAFGGAASGAHQQPARGHMTVRVRSDRSRTPDRPANPEDSSAVEPSRTVGQSGATTRTVRKSYHASRTHARAQGQPKALRTSPDRPDFTREQAEADLVTMLALGQSVPSQRTLADRWGRPKQTVSDWLKGWESSGTIPARRQNGREKTVAAA